MSEYEYNDYVVMLRFGDNDFSSTFRLVFASLREVLQYSGEWEEYKDKTNLAQFINSISFPMYVHGQVGQVRKNYTSKEDLASTQKSILVEVDRLYVGSEVDTFLQNHDSQRNCEWFGLDMRLPRDQQIFVV
tara:strand:+ start:12666 stop:13061 length:396 start_codon:yes stop_codon:yes gene_type:complete